MSRGARAGVLDPHETIAARTATGHRTRRDPDTGPLDSAHACHKHEHRCPPSPLPRRHRTRSGTRQRGRQRLVVAKTSPTGPISKMPHPVTVRRVCDTTIKRDGAKVSALPDAYGGRTGRADDKGKPCALGVAPGWDGDAGTSAHQPQTFRPELAHRKGVRGPRESRETGPRRKSKHLHVDV